MSVNVQKGSTAPAPTDFFAGTYSVPRVNLMPPEIEAERGFKKVQVGLAALTIAVAGLVVGGFVWSAAAASAEQDKLAAQTQRTNELTTEQAKYAEVPLVMGQVEAAQSAQATAMATDVLWYEYLDRLSKSYPDNVFLKDMTVTVTPPVVDPAAAAAGTAVAAPSAPSRSTAPVWCTTTSRTGSTRSRPSRASRTRSTARPRGPTSTGTPSSTSRPPWRWAPRPCPSASSRRPPDMRLTKSQLWISGTALVCAVIVLAGWFLLIAPKRAEAADLRDQTASAVQVNDQLEVRIEQLKAQYAELPQRKAELAAIKLAMPEDAQLATLTRDLTAMATASGVTLMKIEPGVVTPMVTTVAPAATAPAPRVEPAEGADALPRPLRHEHHERSVGDAGRRSRSLGPFDAAEAFVKALQTGDRRYLVDGLLSTAEKPAVASAGRPATVNGDVTLKLTGRVFVLAPVATAAAPAAAATGANN